MIKPSPIRLLYVSVSTCPSRGAIARLGQRHAAGTRFDLQRGYVAAYEEKKFVYLKVELTLVKLLDIVWHLPIPAFAAPCRKLLNGIEAKAESDGQHNEEKNIDTVPERTEVCTVREQTERRTNRHRSSALHEWSGSSAANIKALFPKEATELPPWADAL
jgi:hypothetical protein